MKYINKIFGLAIAGLSISPAVTSCATANTHKTIMINYDGNETDEHERCTVAYVGKKCAKDGLAIIARSNDAAPHGSNSYIKRVNHNQLTNTTIKNNFGFEYTFSGETYAYVSTPDSCKSNPKDQRHLWETMGINEMGVGVTCTLTCFTNDTAKKADPLIPSGIAEETLNQIIAAKADSAKKAMEIVAEIIDKQGNQDANLIMVTDQNETWLMELYTGHEYCAVKLPDDKVMVAGNEFILNNLDELGINESNKDQMCILSPKLLSLPVTNGFAEFSSPTIHDIYHLDLFHTYAGAGAAGQLMDTGHMRTWRGYSLWDPSGAIAQSYDLDTKYPPFFTPKDASGNVRNDMTIHDVIQIYRDEYDELIGKTGFEKFTQAKEDGSLRTIVTERARMVHIMTSNPALPKELACNALYWPSSANYTPALMISNGINTFNDEYSYEPSRWSYDENSASIIYRRLNSLAWPHRQTYGFPLQDMWRIFEYIHITRMNQVINDASKLSISDARNIITNFSKHERKIYIDTIKNVFIDLLWHDMNQDHRAEKLIKPFVPLIDIEQYLLGLGWTDFNRNGQYLTFKYGNDTAKLDIGEGYVFEKGTLYVGDYVTNIDVCVRNDKIYVGLKDLNTAIDGRYKITTININDYLSKQSKSINLALILFLSIGLPVLTVLAVLSPLIIIKRKKKSNKTIA